MKKIFPEVVLMHPNEEKKHKENLFLMFYCEFYTAQNYSHHISHNFFKTCKVALKVKSYFLAYLLYSYHKHVLHCAVQLYTLIL